jgi:hypothetical protein
MEGLGVTAKLAARQVREERGSSKFNARSISKLRRMLKVRAISGLIDLRLFDAGRVTNGSAGNEIGRSTVVTQRA